MKQKHLTFEERIVIEEYLDKGESIHKIALKLGRPDSSVVREVKRNRYVFRSYELPSCEYMWGKNRCNKRFLNSECLYIESGNKCNSTYCTGCNIMCNYSGLVFKTNYLSFYNESMLRRERKPLPHSNQCYAA